MLCKSFYNASASAAEPEDLHPLVGEAAGSMPVCFLNIPKDVAVDPDNGIFLCAAGGVQDLRYAIMEALA